MEVDARQLRTALVEMLLSTEQASPAQPLSHAEYVRTRVNAIHARLAEIVTTLRETLWGCIEPTSSRVANHNIAKVW